MTSPLVEVSPPTSGVARPGWVTVSAVVLLAVAIISGIAALSVLVMSFAMRPLWTETMRRQFEALPSASTMPAGSIDAFSGMMTGVFVVMGVVIGTWAAASTAAGIGILRGRGWARILGIVLGSIGALFAGMAMLFIALSMQMTSQLMASPDYQRLYPSAASADFVAAGTLMTVLFIGPFLVGYLIVVVALGRNGRYFEQQRLG